MLKILERKITLQLLVFYGLFVLPLLLGGVELYLFQRDALQQSAQQADLGLAQAISLEVQTNVQAASEIDVNLARSQAAQQLDLHQLTAMFATSKTSHPDISLYVVCDTSGKVILNYPFSQKAIGQNFSGHDYFQGALASSKPFVSAGRISSATSTYVVSIATRITDNANRPVGVMIVNLSLEQLTSRLMVVRQQLTNSSEVRIWIVDSNGKPIADTEGVSPETNLLTTLPGLKNALEGKPGNVTVHEQERDWLLSSVPVAGTHWAVAVQRPTDVTFAVVISFQHSLILALVMLVVGATFFWFVMHGWVVAPLSRLAQAVSSIKPDATQKVTEGKALAKERHRIDEIGTLIAAVSAMEDEIHDLFRKSDAESQARLHTLDAIMRSMDEGVLLEDSAGQIVYANRRFTQFVGITTQDTLLDSWTGNNLLERLLVLVEDHEAYDEAMHRAESGNSPPVVEFRVRGYYNRVGQLVPVRRDVRMRLFLVRDLSGQIIGRGKLFNDVTQQNEAEQVKKNLLAIVSHELRTPLTAIKGYATSLLATDVELDETLKEHFLQRIVEEGDRMAELVTNLLEMSQLEAGTLKLLPALYRLDSLLEQVVPYAAPLLSSDAGDHRGSPLQVREQEEQRACVRVTVPEDIPLLYVDRRRIEVVLRNLLENARRHCGADATIEISARYEPGQADGGLSLDVTDNGPGLPPHLIERIFDRFYQVDGGRERSSSGVGLGLAICRGFVEAHGGRIWAENRTDGVSGAVFHIWLPPRVLHIPGTQPATFELHNAL